MNRVLESRRRMEYERIPGQNDSQECRHCTDEPEKRRSKRPLLKCVFALISGFVLLGVVVWSKLSFLSLAEAMHDDDDLELQSRCRIFVMLQIILCIPNALNVVRGLWNGILKTYVDWKLYLLVAAISLCESAGICIFTFIIPGYSKTHHIILLMSFALAVPTLITFIRNCLKPDTRPDVVRIIIGCFLEFAAVGLTTYWLITEHATLTILAIIPLSLSWIPCLRRECVDQFKKDKCQNVIKASVWKLTAVMSFFNLVFTIAGSSIIFFTMDLKPFLSSSSMTVKVDIYDYFSGWQWTEWKQATQHEILLFVTHIISGIAGYIVACIACKANLHLVSFVIPLIFCAPIAFGILVLQGSCSWILVRKGRATHLEDCIIGDANELSGILLDIFAIFFFIAANVLFSGWKFYQTDYLKHLTEEQIFRLPAFNSVFLDSWLLLNGQNSEDDSVEHTGQNNVAARSKIYICTTMYHEAEKELNQYIKSIMDIVNTPRFTRRNLEVHVFFDDAVKENQLSDYVVNLVYEVKSIMYGDRDLKKNVFTSDTPYGKCLSFRNNNKDNILFKIHLKDALKVKQKKRWSQVMYMTYVLEHLIKKKDDSDGQQPSTSQSYQQTQATSDTQAHGNIQGTEQDIQLRGTEQDGQQPSTSQSYQQTPAISVDPVDHEMESYLLVTDGDVSFTSDSVEYLLDLIMRDSTLGAVCARTHPRGNGPLYWYQIFEYAVGHWFQKAAEQVLGTVLCAPGCFSIYRCKAVNKVLSEYATDVEEAFDFLIKDMGEDRWFCTLMVQEGWFIEYCAAAKNETQCPENFAEFFKQRRRWLASTVANMLLLNKEWGKIKKKNHRVSRMFQIYQGFLLFASLIGPSSTILVVSGGLKYGWDWSIVTTLVLQIIASFVFGFACLFTSQDTQMKVARLLTFLYAIVMTGVAVGMAVEITTDFINVPEAGPNYIGHNIRISTFTLFLSIVIGMFLLTGILHIKEVGSLCHGLWYFLCLPVGYLLLPIYSICNITDKSWGTRELQTQSNRTEKASWLEIFKNFFSCLRYRNDEKDTDEEGENTVSNQDDETSRKETIESSSQIVSNSIDEKRKELWKNQKSERLETNELDFWEEKMKTMNLKPDQVKDESLKQRLNESLVELRNSWLLIFTVANILWLTLIATLAYKGDVLNVFGTNPVGLVVLVILLLLLTIQFIAMLIHRLSTLIQHVGMASCDSKPPSQDTSRGQSNNSAHPAELV